MLVPNSNHYNVGMWNDFFLCGDKHEKKIHKKNSMRWICPIPRRWLQLSDVLHDGYDYKTIKGSTLNAWQSLWNFFCPHGFIASLLSSFISCETIVAVALWIVDEMNKLWSSKANGWMEVWKQLWKTHLMRMICLLDRMDGCDGHGPHVDLMGVQCHDAKDGRMLWWGLQHEMMGVEHGGRCGNCIWPRGALVTRLMWHKVMIELYYEAGRIRISMVWS
jgi:hypothetical protein